MSIILEVLPGHGSALVVGGGTIALRKARSLIEGGFAVTAVAPEFEPEFERTGATLVERGFELRDIEGHALVLACTDDRELNMVVGEAAKERGLLVLVADSQAESTFFTPAIVRTSDVSVAVSTGGANPAAAADIRDRIAELLATLAPVPPRSRQ